VVAVIKSAIHFHNTFCLTDRFECVDDTERFSRYMKRLRCIPDWNTNTSSTTSAQSVKTDTSRSSWNRSLEVNTVLSFTACLSFPLVILLGCRDTRTYNLYPLIHSGFLVFLCFMWLNGRQGWQWAIWHHWDVSCNYCSAVNCQNRRKNCLYKSSLAFGLHCDVNNCKPDWPPLGGGRDQELRTVEGNSM